MRRVAYFLIFVLFVLASAYFLGRYAGNNADYEIKKTDIDFNYITENARLDVMTAQVSILEDMTIGTNEVPDYKSLATLGFNLDISKENSDGSRYIFSDMYDIIVKIRSKRR